MRVDLYGMVSGGCLLTALACVIAVERGALSSGIGVGGVLACTAVSLALYVRTREARRHATQTIKEVEERLETVIREYASLYATAREGIRTELARVESEIAASGADPEVEAITSLIRAYGRTGGGARRAHRSTRDCRPRGAIRARRHEHEDWFVAAS